MRDRILQILAFLPCAIGVLWFIGMVALPEVFPFTPYGPGLIFGGLVFFGLVARFVAGQGGETDLHILAQNPGGPDWDFDGSD